MPDEVRTDLGHEANRHPLLIALLSPKRCAICENLTQPFPYQGMRCQNDLLVLFWISVQAAVTGPIPATSIAKAPPPVVAQSEEGIQSLWAHVQNGWFPNSLPHYPLTDAAWKFFLFNWLTRNFR